MAEPGFDADVERVRLAAAHKLPASCQDDFQRLSRTLVYGPAFQWLLVDAPNEGLRKQVMAALDEVLRAAGLSANRLPLSEKINDVAMLETRLLKNAGQAAVVHVVGRPGWFNAARWDAFNVRRERLAAQARARLVFWLDAEAIALASSGAPDLWAWRSGVYRFVSSGAALQAPMPKVSASASHGGVASFTPQVSGPDNRSREERLQRIAEIRKWLATVPAPPDELLLAPIDELGQLLFSLDDFDAALQHWRTVALPLDERMGDVRSKAVTMGKIADILHARGQLDEALRIHQQEQLPVFTRLGDGYSTAVTSSKIADILQARGQLGEAMRIHKEEVLPILERLGDAPAKAATMGKIASILQARGQLDEALRIYKEEQLPLFERLGDLREKAVAMGNIADILQARGQLDEALRIFKEEALPVFERLGDVRSKASTMGHIAGILEKRGQLDEALRIRKEEQLPVSERLGDVASQAVTMGKIANILHARGELDEALAMHAARLPLLERTGYAEGVAHVRFSLARIQLARGDHQPEDVKAILDNLEAAFATSLESGRADAIANIGKLLARVLARDKQRERALEVLDHAERAFQTLGVQSDIDEILALRQQIEQQAQITLP